jgi:transposase InsO family protein
MDNNGEFTAKEFTAYCTDERVQHHFSAPYMPQQNGIVEHRNQSMLATARALLKEGDMPACFLGQAVTTSIFLHNRAPTKTLDDKS